MRVFRRLPRVSVNAAVATALILANFFTWGQLLSAAAAPYQVAPIRAPQIESLLAYIRSGEHSGEAWEITLTELEAEQTIAWYLAAYPQIPFEHPQVEITPDYVSGEGDVTLLGLRVHVSGKARITLDEGLPVVEILALSLPLPGSLRQAVESEIQRQLRRADLLPVRFTSAEWRDGEVTVMGYVR